MGWRDWPLQFPSDLAKSKDNLPDSSLLGGRQLQVSLDDISFGNLYRMFPSGALIFYSIFDLGAITQMLRGNAQPFGQNQQFVLFRNGLPDQPAAHTMESHGFPAPAQIEFTLQYGRPDLIASVQQRRA